MTKKIIFLIAFIALVILIFVLFFNPNSAQLNFQTSPFSTTEKFSNKYCAHFKANTSETPPGITAHQFCIGKGYDKCFAAVAYRKGELYSSSDLTCSGSIQIVNRVTRFERSCGSNGLGLIATTCSSNIDENLEEPFYGDEKITDSTDEVICCDTS
jgi:hypothetical protein